MASSSGGAITWASGDPGNVLSDALETYVSVHITGAIDKAANSFADSITQWMKDSAPWEDVTGDARSRLTTTYEKSGDLYTFTLSHGVDYGYFLETMQSGKFSILTPALAQFGPQVVNVGH